MRFSDVKKQKGWSKAHYSFRRLHAKNHNRLVAINQISKCKKNKERIWSPYSSAKIDEEDIFGMKQQCAIEWKQNEHDEQGYVRPLVGAMVTNITLLLLQLQCTWKWSYIIASIDYLLKNTTNMKNVLRKNKITIYC